MLKLNENYEVGGTILKGDYKRCSLAETSTTKTSNCQIYIYINISREDSVISSSNRYRELNFEVIKKADNSTYANCDDIRLVILGPIALFSNFNLTTSSGEHLEDISHANIVSLMFKKIPSAKDSKESSLGFDRVRKRRQREITNNKNKKGKFLITFKLKDVFGFAERPKKLLTD